MGEVICERYTGEVFLIVLCVLLARSLPQVSSRAHLMHQSVLDATGKVHVDYKITPPGLTKSIVHGCMSEAQFKTRSLNFNSHIHSIE